ncbi:monooxygenase [Laetiporus sulphureus 93-53]|uniref:Monooxygenase n=1 Tax=Laetiporus sulphureus 93-53 TaxID=1314785 RepID=A0A165ER53_9APHY|nr:monooxygenase [Laetiporus sulphureus 93-53]KZT07594.1 monooxygenase [Laetiporus sulphureus 93-53]
MSSATHLPVLIVGAGPTGLTLALTLAQNGIPFRIIEKEINFHVGQRGAGIQPRTLEVYNLLGVLPDILQQGIPFAKLQLYKLPGGVEIEKAFWMIPPLVPSPSKPYINAWLLGQAHGEAILRSHLEKFGYHVELGTELRSLEQNADYVTAHIAKRDGDHETVETVTCRWLVGADGGKGIVRKQLGLTFLGESLSAEMIIGDVEVKGIDNNHWHIWGSTDTTLLILRPTEDENLFFFAISGKIDYANIMMDDHELFDAIRKASDRKELEFGAVPWKSDYRPNVRMVNKFSEGRVFVAGDAAHVHSPAGGQGLNSGVQDALNLAWKLSLVEKGLASPSLLSTYNEERLPVIKAMLEETTAIFHSVLARTANGMNNEAGWNRGEHMRQLGVNYRWSSIVRDERAPVGATEPMDPYGINSGDVPRAGDRAPDAPGLVNVKSTDASEQPTSLFRIFSTTRHTILVFSPDSAHAGPALEALTSYPADAIQSVVIYLQDASSTPHVDGANLSLVDRDGHAYSGYAVEKGGLTIVIVRPDGVIGAIARGVDGLKAYFRGIFTASA